LAPKKLTGCLKKKVGAKHVKLLSITEKIKHIFGNSRNTDP
jgi:hypothetical protein